MKTLVLDVDDCLYPAGCGLHEQIKERIVAVGEQFRSAINNFTFDDHEHITNFPQVVRSLAVTDVTLLNEFLSYSYNANYAQAPVDVPLRVALESYSGRKTIYTSGPYEPHVVALLKHLGLQHIFPPDTIVDVLRCGDNLKPTPKGYANCCELLRVSPEETIYFDDGLKNLHGAKMLNGNVTTVWVNHAGHELVPDLCPPDYTTVNLAKFITTLEDDK